MWLGAKKALSRTTKPKQHWQRPELLIAGPIITTPAAHLPHASIAEPSHSLHPLCLLTLGQHTHAIRFWLCCSSPHRLFTIHRFTRQTNAACKSHACWMSYDKDIQDKEPHITCNGAVIAAVARALPLLVQSCLLMGWRGRFRRNNPCLLRGHHLTSCYRLNATSDSSKATLSNVLMLGMAHGGWDG